MIASFCQTRFVEGALCSPFLQCPYCDHSLIYRFEHEDAAKLAMVSHLVRCHEITYWHFVANMKPLKKAAEEYFNAGKLSPYTGKTEWTAGYLRPEV